jgi:phage-related protein
MANQTLEIEYLIKAVDEASQTIKRIENEMNRLGQATESVDQTTQEMGKTQKAVFNGLKDGYQKAGELANAYGLSLVAVTGFLGMAVNKALDFADAIANNLNAAMEKNIKAFAEDEAQLRSFTIVVESLSEASNGALGTLEEWNGVVDQAVKATGEQTESVQRAVREFLLFGNSIDASKQVMESLIPIASDLAIVNGVDLNSALDAVALGLNGQTRALKGLGVVISQGDIEDLARQYGLVEKNLTDAQRQQITYELILKKSMATSKAAADAQDSLAFAMKRQASQIGELGAAFGRGGAIVEKFKISAVDALINSLNGMGEGFLKAIGFIGSMTGSFLSLTVTVAKVGIALGTTVASIVALNAAMTSSAAVGFLASLQKTQLVANLLSGTFGPIAQSVLTIATSFTTAGITISTAIGAITVLINGLISTTLRLLVVWSPIIALVGAVGGSLYILYKAFVLIEDKTKVFTTTWAKFTKTLESLGVFTFLSSAIESVGNALGNILSQAIESTAIGIIKLINLVNESRIVFIRLVDFIVSIPSIVSQAFSSALNSVKSFLSGIPSQLGALIGLNTAYAESVDGVNLSISQSMEAKRGLSKEDQKSIDMINNQINANNKLIESIRRQTIEVNKATKEREAASKLSTGGGAKSSNNKGLEDALKIFNILNSGNVSQEANAINQAIDAIRLNASESIILNLSSSQVKSVFTEIQNQIIDIQNKLKTATNEDAQGLIDKLTSLTEKAVEIKFVSKLSAVAEIGSAVGGGALSVLKSGVGAVATAFGGPFGSIIGDILKTFIELFSKSPEEFKKMIVNLITETPKLIMNIVENLYSTIFDAVFEGTLKSLEELPDMLGGLVERLTEKFADPTFLHKFINGIVFGVIKAIPRVVTALVNGIVRGMTKAIRNAGNVFSNIGKSIAGVGKFFGFKGFKNGGIPALMPALKAASGMIVPGQRTFGDKVPVSVNSREMILNLDQQAKLFNMIQQGFTSNQRPIEVYTTVELDNRALGKSLNRLEANGWR